MPTSSSVFRLYYIKHNEFSFRERRRERQCAREQKNKKRREKQINSRLSLLVPSHLSHDDDLESVNLVPK